MGTQIHPVRWLLSSFHPETPFFSSPAKGEGVSGWKLSNRVNADFQDKIKNTRIFQELMIECI